MIGQTVSEPDCNDDRSKTVGVVMRFGFRARPVEWEIPLFA